jgi:hypothetical protein
MREGLTGYIPGSVWVPWSLTRPETRKSKLSSSWLRRLLAPKRLSVYQCCLALHILGASKHEKATRP